MQSLLLFFNPWCLVLAQISSISLFNLSTLLTTLVKWSEHFTESAIFPLRQCCIYKIGNPIVEFSGFYMEVIGPQKKSSLIYLGPNNLDTFWWNCQIIFRCASIQGRAGIILCELKRRSFIRVIVPYERGYETSGSPLRFMLRRSSLVECVSVLPGNRCLQNVEFFFLRQYVQPCLLKNPKYTFYTRWVASLDRILTASSILLSVAWWDGWHLLIGRLLLVVFYYGHW
jgi:hypothetical protein